MLYIRHLMIFIYLKRLYNKFVTIDFVRAIFRMYYIEMKIV